VLSIDSTTGTVDGEMVIRHLDGATIEAVGIDVLDTALGCRIAVSWIEIPSGGSDDPVSWLTRLDTCDLP